MANGRPAPKFQTQTRTISTLEVSGPVYDEIAAKLRKADYFHVFLDDGTIDMNGIGLVRLALRQAKPSV
jgi:hypothetical protein